jgi:hypothetical protein
MNLALLLIASRLWTADPTGAFARVTAAVAILTIEMQIVTLTGLGSLSALVLVNAAIAIASLIAWRPRRSTPARDRDATPSVSTALPWPVIGGMAALALALATRPLAGADPYHLERVAQILRLGTLAFDDTADIKVNVLASSYELVLADLRQVPAVGALLLQLHAVASLAYFTLGVAAIRQWLPGGPTWCWAAPFLLPVVFHQFAFVKNDLYSATPALVVLAWLATRAATAPSREVGAVATLTGLAIAMKWVAFPLGLLVLGTIAWQRPRDGGAWIALVLGGVAGAVAGALPLTLLQTARWYGHPFEPLAELGNRTTSAAGALVSVGRFAISLFDFGLVTRSLWPDRGGWGATFGAPLAWAIAVSVLEWRDATVRRAAALVLAYWVVFAAVYPDADVAHRLVLAPAVLLVAVAAHRTGGESATAVWLRRSLAIALAISAAQIARSLWLYLTL